jgi:hypothetical protein
MAPAMMPATCVPWPTSSANAPSGVGSPAPVKSRCRSATSGWSRVRWVAKWRMWRDSGVDDRPDDPVAVGVERAARRVGLDGHARAVDVQVDREVGPDAVQAAPRPLHRSGVGGDQPLELVHGQLAAGVLAGHSLRPLTARDPRPEGVEAGEGGGSAAPETEVDLGHDRDRLVLRGREHDLLAGLRTAQRGRDHPRNEQRLPRFAGGTVGVRPQDLLGGGVRGRHPGPSRGGGHESAAPTDQPRLLEVPQRCPDVPVPARAVAGDGVGAVGRREAVGEEDRHLLHDGELGR